MNRNLWVFGALLLCAMILPSYAEASGSKDRTPPKLQSVHIQSNGANASVAKAGDKVSITFTASEKVTPVVLVETRTLFVRATNSSGNSWEASYTVDPKDKTGRVDYLITVVDTAGNIYACASRRLLVIPACPSDGSIVTIEKPTTPQPDTVPPVISGVQDYTVVATDQNGTVVSYTLPTATDAKDGMRPVVCTPAPGTLFPVGTTTVSCSAADTAGNTASASFAINVLPPPPPPAPTPVVVASQSDESTLCTPSWRDCYTGGAPERSIDLGAGSALGTKGILSVTIAKDETSPFVSQPWIASILCYTNAAHTQLCPDWVAPNAWNSNQHHLITAAATTTTDGKHWTAYFANPSHESNADGSYPVTFRPEYYYELVINDNGWEIGAYGSATEPYWVLMGI